MKTRCNSIHLDNLLTDLGEREARSFTLEYATQVKTDYMLMIDADVHLVNADTLRILVETAYNLKIGILSPLVVQQDKFFSNFWGAISENGYYARSHDYIEIVKQQRTGIWNVPFINSVYLIANWKFDHLKEAYSANPKLDPDMAFCDFARSSGHFMYVDNRQYFGFLVISDDFDPTKLHPEMYQIFDNRYLWESRYIPKEYFNVLAPEAPVNQPCQDVYDFPLMSEMFCKELIEEMENFGEWSSGKNQVMR
ncbi:unnamed protein product [Anisakis simplex]|uniref:Procollagen lysyl hydroxylase (inferred by orthology to a D. melanogaster protein) n=1 Tax=Anisakis simplex TaxID=6269 RepID=A0A0M3J225_ANISI|nr:unnamed protein product [Anisakis simplex]